MKPQTHELENDMKLENAHDITYALSPKDVTALAAAIIKHADSEAVGRATYLRSLLAGVQVELLGKPVLRALRGNHKAPTIEEASAAFEKVNAAYYEAVLAAVPDGLDALERNAKTSFARSSASTLRRAIKLGWNPLTALHEVSKGGLSRWVKEHSVPRPINAARAERVVMRLVGRISDMVAQLPQADADRVLSMGLADLGVTPAPAVPRLRSVSLRRHPPERAAAQH
jgi:hypothetical protein